jgi:hypothetical protein
MMQTQQKPITYDDLMTLYNDMTILPDAIILRLLMTRDGKYVLTRVNENGGIDHRRLDLTGPLTLEEMYRFLSKMSLQAFKEED